MMAYLKPKSGQSTMEYAVLIIIIIAALIAVLTYIKRGVQGRMKQSADDIGDQYSPGNTNVVKQTRTVSNEQQRFGGALGQGAQETKMLAPENTRTEMRKAIVNADFEYYGQ